MKNKKTFVLGVITGALVFGSIGVLAQTAYQAVKNTFKIELNGEKVEMEGYNIDGFTYFKLRDIAECVGGFDVDFNNNTIQLSKDGYVYAQKAGKVYNDYSEFEKLFSAQEYVIDDDLSVRINNSDGSTVGMLEATNESIDAIIQKIYDIANFYLKEYDESYAITTEEIEKLCSDERKRIVEIGEKDGTIFWTGGTMDILTNVSCSWDAAKNILKQYYYELYQYTGTVEVTLGVG